jgi:wobble nucleotide-excising tRNase
MIIRISKIKNFGVFRDFTWATKTAEFKKHNAFYGWNYSGKTTISRVFACFENQAMHQDYPSAEFELVDDAGKKYSNTTLDQLPNVRVFNVDFVERNLRSFQSDLEIEPLFILGQENIELQEKLKVLNEEAAGLKAQNETLATERDSREKSLRAASSAKAKQIKETLIIPDYEKRHLDPRVTEVKANPSGYLLEDQDYINAFSIYQNKDQKDTISLHSPPTSKFVELRQRVEEVAKKRITAQSIIPALKDDPQLSAWVKEGRILHEHRTDCQFCGNTLSHDLFERLNQHFSDEYAELETRLAQLRAEIEKHENEVLEYINTLPDRARLYAEFERQYEREKANLTANVRSYNEALGKLVGALDLKKSRPFEEQSFVAPNDPSELFGASAGSLAAVVRAHNDKTNNFDKEKEEARAKLIDHFAAEFVNEQNLLAAEEENAKRLKKIGENSQLLLEKAAKIRDLEGQLSDSVKGAEKVNEYIQQFFRHDGIRLEVTESKKFRLTRGDVPAKNLSEGEKTAISLAYFVAKLEDRGADIERTIVFIDDPVSSLDSNHLFNIYAFIRAKLEKCQQLFISTHNMDFFNLVKDFLGDMGHRNKPELPCYLIDRQWNATVNRSVMVDLPKVLKCHRSEYSYLFSVLREFDSRDLGTIDQHETLYLIPNVARRFLEAYLGLRYPDGRSWEGKLERLITDETRRNQIKKLVHEYSHNRSATRALRFPEAGECKEVVHDIVESLKIVDKGHYDALCTAE